MRLRFDARELSLLRAAEEVRGASLAHNARPDLLRNALALSRAGHKLAHAHEGTPVVLDEAEVHLLEEALRFATDEVHWVSARHGQPGARQASVLHAFPELTERGLWRTFGLCRELETLADRLHKALSA